jgi:hypothetical protein
MFFCLWLQPIPHHPTSTLVRPDARTGLPLFLLFASLAWVTRFFFGCYRVGSWVKRWMAIVRQVPASDYTPSTRLPQGCCRARLLLSDVRVSLVCRATLRRGCGTPRVRNIFPPETRNFSPSPSIPARSGRPHPFSADARAVRKKRPAWPTVGVSSGPKLAVVCRHLRGGAR